MLLNARDQEDPRISAEYKTTRPPTPRVLLVEGDPDVRDLLVLYLSLHRLEVVATRTPAEAKDRLDHEEFGAIVFDLDQLESEGLALVEDAEPEGVVILGSRRKMSNVSDWPPGRLFTKPFALEDLSAKLEEMLSFWRS